MQAKVQTAQIKAEARKAILAPLGLLVFTNVLYESIGGVLQSVVTAVLPEGGISLFILSISLSFIILILLGVLDTGIRSMYLALVFGGTPTGADMFRGFRENTNRIVQVRTLYAVIQTICLFPIQYWLFFSADEMLVLASGNTSAQETAEIARSVLSSMPPVIIMQTIGFLLLIAVSIRFSIPSDGAPGAAMPDTSPLTSQRKTGMPASEKDSAMTFIVMVLPVPLAPAMRPCRLHIFGSSRTLWSSARPIYTVLSKYIVTSVCFRITITLIIHYRGNRMQPVLTDFGCLTRCN